MNTRMTYSNYWLPIAAQHIKEFTGNKSDVEPGHMLISGALTELIAAAMAKAFEHIEEQAEANLVTGIGGHRNEAGGWCSPVHGNTCGFHSEFDN